MKIYNLSIKMLTCITWSCMCEASVGNTDTEPIPRYFQIPIPIPTSV